MLDRRRVLQLGVAGGLASVVSGPVKAANEWPQKPVKIIVPYPAGGQTDIIARTYGEYLSRQLHQPFIVENKAGASGIVGTTEIKRAPPDGHSLLLTIGSSLINNNGLFKELPYDADKDFVLIASITGQGLPMVASTSIGVKTLPEFIEHVRKKGRGSIGTYGPASAPHITAIQLNSQYGLNIDAVHYRGEAPMWADLMAGSIDAAIGSYTAALPAIQSGKGTPIGSLGSAQISLMPEVKPLFQQGVTSEFFRLRILQGILAAPTGTPDAVIKKLSDLMVAAGNDAKVVAAVGPPLEKPVGREETTKIYQTEAPIMRKLVTSLNLTPQ